MIKKLVINILLIFVCLPSSVAATDLSMFGDLLVWQASQQPASTWATVAKGAGLHTVDVTATNVNFHYNLGFRGGFVYEPSDMWDSALYWTYFKTRCDHKITNGLQLVYPEFFSGFVSQNYFFGATLNWKLLMNMLDYDIGHKFNIGQYMTLRPNIGLKGGTINQTIKSEWKADVYNSFETIIHNFFGIGPSFGLDTTWLLFKGLYMFGDFDAAFLWGNWKINDTYTRPNVPGIVTPVTIITSGNNQLLGTMMFAYFLGFEYAHEGRSNIAFKVGYEMQFWANQLRMPTFQQLPVHGDLTFQGATCRLVIDL